MQYVRRRAAVMASGISYQVKTVIPIRYLQLTLKCGNSVPSLTKTQFFILQPAGFRQAIVFVFASSRVRVRAPPASCADRTRFQSWLPHVIYFE